MGANLKDISRSSRRSSAEKDGISNFGLCFSKRYVKIVEAYCEEATEKLPSFEKLERKTTVMIWFNIKELESRLINGEVTDKVAFTYLLTHLILITLASYIQGDEDPFWMVLVHLMISLGSTIWGLKKTYEINQRGGNREYLKRFLSLSFVSGVRMVVFVFLFLFGINLLTLLFQALGMQTPLSALAKNVLELAGFVLMVGVYYYILLKSFRRINTEDAAEGVPA